MPDPTYVFANFMVGELISAIDADDTTISVTPSMAALLESFVLADSKQAQLVLWNGQNDPEIVGVTDNDQSGSMTVIRAEESTTARAWEAGTQVRCAITAAMVTRAMLATLTAEEIMAANFLPLEGGTLTGDLTLDGDPDSDLKAATKQYVDSILGDKLPLTGGTMAGSINMNSNRLLALPAAVASTEPLTKGTHDAAITVLNNLNADRSGALTTSGTSAAFTITTNSTFAGLSDGITVRARVHTDNEDSATLAVDGLTAKAIQREPGVAISQGLLKQDLPYDFVYSSGYDAWLVAGIISEWYTGDVKQSFRSTADPGWLMMDDGTIGNVASGADFADLGARALYAVLWDSVSDTYAPVAGGRGASAAADWAANKKMTLTAVLGRALIAAGTGSGLTARALGATDGEEDHVLLEAEMAEHTHVQDAHGHEFYYLNASAATGGTVRASALQQTDGGGYTQVLTSETTATNQNTGSDTAHNNMQPWLAVNVMIHL